MAKFKLVYCYECGGKHRLYCTNNPAKRRHQEQKNISGRRMRAAAIIARMHALLVPDGPRLCPDLPCWICERWKAQNR